MATRGRRGRLETGLHLFVALVVVAGIVGRSLTFALGLVGIWALIITCLRYISRTKQRMASVSAHVARDRRSRRREPGLRYNLCLTGVLYLIPIGLGTAFYVLLSAYVAVFADRLDLEQLIAFQETLQSASEFFSKHLKLNAVQVLALLVATYLFNCLLLSVRPGRAGDLDRRGKGRWLAVRIWVVTTIGQGVGLYYYSAGCRSLV